MSTRFQACAYLFKQTCCREEDKISSKSRPLDNEFARKKHMCLEILFLYLDLIEVSNL